MNWGYKIFLSLAVFMIAIVAAGVYMVSNDSDTLEEEDYYEQGLNYDSAYEKKKNVLDFNEEPSISVRNDTLYIVFKAENNKGKLTFRKPSDKNQDKELPFQSVSRLYQLPVSAFEKGLWNLYIDWKTDGKQFLVEKDIHF